MSHENVEVVRRMWQAFLSNDFETALSAFDAEVEWDGTNLPDGTISTGVDAVVEHLTKWAEMWETWEVELDEVIDAGGPNVIAFTHERGRMKAGLEVNERHSELYRVHDGKITYRKGFSDAELALDEAGIERGGTGSSA
jgi:ketosteroid isomerase-like protein